MSTATTTPAAGDPFVTAPQDAKTLPPAEAVLDRASAEQQAGFDTRLRELHNERFADGQDGGAGGGGQVDLRA